MAASPPPSAASIREEAEDDFGAVRELHAAAFGRPDEARLVDALRAAAHPCVSLVAERDGRVAGHILFTPVTLAGFSGLLMGLAPVAVLPRFQRRGIGGALVRAGVGRCRDLGAQGVVVMGHPQYYPRFGFVPAARFGLACEYDAPADAFMALELASGALREAAGTVRYHAAFAGA